MNSVTVILKSPKIDFCFYHKLQKNYQNYHLFQTLTNNSKLIIVTSEKYCINVVRSKKNKLLPKFSRLRNIGSNSL